VTKPAAFKLVERAMVIGPALLETLAQISSTRSRRERLGNRIDTAVFDEANCL
jgi:hypothetical protein